MIIKLPTKALHSLNLEFLCKSFQRIEIYNSKINHKTLSNSEIQSNYQHLTYEVPDLIFY